MKNVTTDDLIRDLSIVIEDLEALADATAHSTSEKVEAIRTRARQLVKSVKSRLQEVEQHVADRTKSAVKEADAFVREHAWETIAAAAKAGVLVGLLLHGDKRQKD